MFPGEHLATVGVFDGVHRGHQAILASMLEASAGSGLPCLVATFHPRPVRVFAPDAPPDELTPVRRKLRLLAEIGITRVLVLRFSRAFADMEPERFLEEMLGAGGGLRGLWVGHDFRFGKNRRGDWDLVRRAARGYGYEAHRVDAVHHAGRIVSSSEIRRALREGDVETAASLLGRPPDLEGTVVSGRGQGAKVLVPTANLRLAGEQFLPAPGVYAGSAEWDGEERRAVMNLGRRPTLTGGETLVPEVHVLDWQGDLLGRSLLFRLGTRLREERKFASLKELQDQVARDIDRAREIPMPDPL